MNQVLKISVGLARSGVNHVIKGNKIIVQGAKYTENTLIQFPAKTWGYVGSVHPKLSYVMKDGSEPTEKDLKNANHVGPRIAGLKTLAWKKPIDALKAAKKLNTSVTIPEHLSKDKEIMKAVKQSGVKYIIK